MGSLRHARAFCLLGASCALAAFASTAGAQTSPARADPWSVVYFRVNLANRDSGWLSTGAAIALDLGVGANNSSVTLRALHLGAPPLSCEVGGSGNTTVTLTGFTVDALAGAGVTLPLQPDPVGPNLLFTGQSLSESALGNVNYSTAGLLCNSLRSAGGACTGPYSLAAAGVNGAGQVTSGSISPTAGANGARTFAINYYGSFPLAVGATWGSVDVLAQLTGNFPTSAAAVCGPDFNMSGDISILDIFDFLNAWFAADPRADFNHVNGIGVQDIFDFLNGWFAGC